MKRIDAISEFVNSSVYSKRKTLVVSNLGYCSRELFSLADEPKNFYMLGSMGLASSVGLGISLVSRRREVFVLEGDASLLMNLGSLATIANSALSNFHLLVIDNREHGSTGGQVSHTGMGTDLLEMAKAAGIQDAIKVDTCEKLQRMLRANKISMFILIECQGGNADVPIISLNEIEIRDRFTKLAMNKRSPKHQ